MLLAFAGDSTITRCFAMRPLPVRCRDGGAVAGVRSEGAPQETEGRPGEPGRPGKALGAWAEQPSGRPRPCGRRSYPPPTHRPPRDRGCYAGP
ncbi:hypothetical protein AN478_01835 [Thiohalorhabdus denitrificans]|nr:hypothetical protein AN478_01835 [Thiohalorhabdus denitrificans]